MRRPRKSSFLLPDWQALAEGMDCELFAFLSDYEKQSNTSCTGARHFFWWAKQSAEEEAVVLIQFLNDRARAHATSRATQIIYEAVATWNVAAVEELGLTGASARGYHVNLSRALEALSNQPEVRFPRIVARSLKYQGTRIETHGPSLAELPWPELTDIPASTREAFALSMVRDEALKLFERDERTFWVGQNILKNKIPPTAELQVPWHALRNLLLLEHRSWKKTGRSQFYGGVSATSRKYVNELFKRDVWTRLGVDTEGWPEELSWSHLLSVILSCFGPTNVSAYCVAKFFACETGWNKSPINLLPTVPFAFGIKKKVFIGSERVLAAFKKRAGHFVFANSQTIPVASGIVASNVFSTWQNVLDTAKCSLFDETHEVDDSSHLMTVLQRYEAMTDVIREHCEQDVKGNFFIYVTMKRRISTLLPTNPIKSGLFSRQNSIFQAVRKSFIRVARSILTTNDELRPIAGHDGAGILEKHYLADPEREQAIRFFQNCLQATVADDIEALKLSLDEVAFRYFRLLADHCGISSACGLGDREVPIDEAFPEGINAMEEEAEAEQEESNQTAIDEFLFVPSAENLAELFIAHQALKAAKRREPRERWMVQGFPLLAIVLAIARTLFEKGLRPAYRRAVEPIRQALQEGHIALPAVLEV